MNMTFDDAQRFLLDKLDAADADNMIRFIRGQEASNLALNAKLKQIQDAGLATTELDMGNYVEVPADQWKQLCDAMFLNLPSNAANNNGWISVDERLPEDGKEVIVHSLGQIVQVTRNSKYAGGFKQRNCYGWQCIYNISHWREVSFNLPSEYHFYLERNGQPLPPAPEQAK